jgi:hypothetical protein
MKQELADRLEVVAKKQNRSVEELLALYIPGFTTDQKLTADLNASNRVDEFERWADSFPDTGHPPLSDEAISRESIYGDR